MAHVFVTFMGDILEEGVQPDVYPESGYVGEAVLGRVPAKSSTFWSSPLNDIIQIYLAHRGVLRSK